MMGFVFDAVTDIRDQVGESPIWDTETRSLYWVDIIGKSIHHLDTRTSKIRSWDTDDFPTAIALRHTASGAVVALAGGAALFDFESGAVTSFSSPDPTEGNRLNEGRCDPSGRFWVGSMRTNLNPDGSGREIDQHSGALFRIDPNGSATRLTEFEFGISNTMAWSPDERTFYFGDSLRNVIFAFDYDADTGGLSNRRVLLENYAHGVPDGSAIDDDGCLWNARFGGSRIIRITPDGRIDREIAVPVTNPTSCTFGASDRKTLYVTSAQFTLTETQLQTNPLEGALLATQTDCTGLPDYRFAG
ncbi:MAG: SMP-30/gluconolactonase/LRE family protein [Roseibium album]|uniref:SMP-30/gluconolactonase/LRE family protein n=1 Tax=Roseibium album TaxID=311410 RepID=UPI0032EC9988